MNYIHLTGSILLLLLFRFVTDTFLDELLADFLREIDKRYQIIQPNVEQGSVSMGPFDLFLSDHYKIYCEFGNSLAGPGASYTTPRCMSILISWGVQWDLPEGDNKFNPPPISNFMQNLSLNCLIWPSKVIPFNTKNKGYQKVPPPPTFASFCLSNTLKFKYLFVNCWLLYFID